MGLLSGGWVGASSNNGWLAPGLLRIRYVTGVLEARLGHRYLFDISSHLLPVPVSNRVMLLLLVAERSAGNEGASVDFLQDTRKI